ncbi:GHMP kinase [soil metagenome]
MSVAAEPDLIITRTPLRVSLAGGGTDLPAYYDQGAGAVLSTTVGRYVYVTVKRHGPVFDERVRLNYSLSESVHEIDAIRNNIARECLRLLGIDPPIYVSVVSDLPDSSGLGGSSSFAVGLLNALHVMRGEWVDARQLAEEASHVEMDLLGEPIGKQDTYAAAFGGMNLFHFQPDGTVTIDEQRPQPDTLDRLFSSMLMVWTGHQRRASSVLLEQRDKTSANRTVLDQMREHAFEVREMIHDGGFRPEQLGRLLDASWALKRSLASNVSNEQLNHWYDAACAAGAWGGKVCGAGGGGFFLFIAPPEAHADICAAMGDLRSVPLTYSAEGSKVLLPIQ